MMGNILETRYNGYLFRSRLEARWAVFFDVLNIRYHYETEGFNLNGIWYLPDFYIPKMRCWIEIKGSIPTEGEMEKAGLLAAYRNEPVYIFYGDVWPDVQTVYFYSERPKPDRIISYVQTAITNKDIDVALAIIAKYRHKYWKPEIDHIKEHIKYLSKSSKELERIFAENFTRDLEAIQKRVEKEKVVGLDGSVRSDNPYFWGRNCVYWMECDYCHTISLRGDKECDKCSFDPPIQSYRRNGDNLMRAYIAARQERFSNRS